MSDESNLLGDYVRARRELVTPEQAGIPSVGVRRVPGLRREELTSPTAPGVTRTYTTWKVLTDENVDARVWSGIHTRSADQAGVRLGRQVAAYALRHAARLFS
ncbi:hypothetical protein [Nonomuraea sp. NPDC050786]|uniref:hypothetical protein n=1 Tax=Nonomuraea sp. NPDC050786 TaxID=3154840 RepID=UPI0033DAC5F8